MDINALLKSLTREEKIGQLLQIAPFYFIKHSDVQVFGNITDLNLNRDQVFQAGSVLGIGSREEMREVQEAYLKHSRHKIPLVFMADIIHGFQTIFPVPLGLASSFNDEHVMQTARVSALEASTSGIHVTFSPMADLVRDPRWGRVVESFGEDPYLNGRFTATMVKGYQMDDVKSIGHLASCVKHFAAYGKVEAGRDYNTVDLSRTSLHYDYLTGYREAIKAGAKLIMTSFNVFECIPATVNDYLLKKVLRDLWDFKGVVISDYDSLHQIIAHGVAKDDKEAAFKGIQAGLDIEMASTAYVNYLSELIDLGYVDEKLIDDACYRVLKLKDELGLFENPYKHGNHEIEASVVRSKEHLHKALKAAEESIVLLENNGTLPLKKHSKIALVGPYSQNGQTNGPWSWHGNGHLNETLYDVLKEDYDIVYTLNSEHLLDYNETILKHIQEVEYVIYACGEMMKESGEAHNRAILSLPRDQESIYLKLKQHAKKLVTIIFAGRPLILNHVKTSDALLYAWFPGTMGTHAIKHIINGEVSPSGKLPMSFPRHEGQIPIYYNHLNTGRPRISEQDEYTSYYLDMSNHPLYPFGYGLSYTTFKMHKPQLELVNEHDVIAYVKVTIDNVGDYDGKEVIQLYIRDFVASIARPTRELKAFQKIFIPKHESKEVTFTITKDMLMYYNQEGNHVFEPGEFGLYIGFDVSKTDEVMLHVA